MRKDSESIFDELENIAEEIDSIKGIKTDKKIEEKILRNKYIELGPEKI